MTMTINSNPRIYAACLAAYNNGRLHGAWIDCDGRDGDAIRQEIAEMLAKSPYPNVQRVRCTDCDHIQGYIANDTCDECGGDLSEPFASAEEWAIHDHEGFAGLITSEWPDLDEVAAMAEILDDDDEDKRRGLFWLVGGLGYKVADAIQKCEDVRTYDGTAQEYAESFIDDCYSDALDKLPDLLKFHIDYEGITRDLLLGGDIAEVEAGEERFIVTNANEF